MKKIKVAFADAWAGFEKPIIEILQKRYQVEISDNPDFLIYSFAGKSYKKYKNCVKIFFSYENILPNFNECDYALGLHDMSFGKRYKRIAYEVTSKDTSASNIPSNTLTLEDLQGRRFCNFVYSNSTLGKGSAFRMELCKRLMEYKHVDCPGRVLNNMSISDAGLARPKQGHWNWEKQKVDLLKQYKFTIAIENQFSENGYWTEKIMHPFISKSIPIYSGSSTVGEVFNTKAFINCHDYDNDIDKIIKRIIEIDTNDDLYLEMVNAKPVLPDSYLWTLQEDVEGFLFDIFEKGVQPFEKRIVVRRNIFKKVIRRMKRILKGK